MVVVEWVKESVASVPVTVMVYVPAGVPLLPLLLLLPPPQATWKTMPANNVQASPTASIRPLLLRPELGPKLVTSSAISGKQTA